MTIPKTRVLLLIEDSPGDAELVNELLAQSDQHFKVIHVGRVAEGVEALKTTEVDVVVLDLRLPDSEGADTVKTVRRSAGQTPIVVLTGSDDERLALACIDAGAQDYLGKAEVGPQNLRRAIGYAITRLRETQIRDLHATLEQYRALSSATQGTTVTAALAGSGAIAVRSPERFAMVVREYFRLLGPYLDRETDTLDVSRVSKERVVTALGDLGGGPRDLLDVHVAAMEMALETSDPHAQTVVFEGRLLAIEMMGLLVDYYRVGYRRRFVEGTRS